MTSIRLPAASAAPLWSVVQALGLLLTVVLLVALVERPAPTLHVLWDMVIPLLPAVFFINPMLWRNVCPLGTLNHLTGAHRGKRLVAPGRHEAVWLAGILLLVLMVPARRFLFNEHGAVLAGTIAAVGVLALAGGLIWFRRAAFCSGICPVLPVEKLYGQSPLLRVGSARCTDCNLCAGPACLDLAGGKSARQSLGATRGGHWLLTPFGGFAAAFPGFVIGYFNTANGGLSTAGSVYLSVGLWSAGSYVVVSAAVRLAGLRTSVALVLLGGLAGALYYWFVAPSLAAAWGAPEAGPILVRVLALGLLVVWLRSALRRTMGRTVRATPTG